MSEIRIHALRDPQLAAAYLAQEDEMRDSVAQIIDDIGRAQALRFRVPADEAARLMLTVWEGASVRAAMAGLDYEEMCRRTSEELARVAQLIIELARALEPRAAAESVARSSSEWHRAMRARHHSWRSVGCRDRVESVPHRA